MNLNPNEYPSYYEKYLPLIKGGTLLENLEQGNEKLINLAAQLSEEKWNHRYAPEKWTIKEVINHVTDCERVFQYRALCFSRGEKKPIAGFDENEYSKNSNANNRSSESILEEAIVVRNSTIQLFKNLSDEQLITIGDANGRPNSVRAIGWFIPAHQQHHFNVIQERYL